MAWRAKEFSKFTNWAELICLKKRLEGTLPRPVQSSLTTEEGSAMNASIIHEIGEFPILKVLIEALEATDRDLNHLWAMDGNDEEYQQAYDRHWAIREAINATPARTFCELRAKARAAEIELERDVSGL